MGYGMATNVRQKLPSSSKLFIQDVYRPACEKFISENEKFGSIEIVQSAKEAAEKANVVISCLPSIETLRTVYLNKDSGVLAAPSDPERLILECSTIDIASAREVAGEIAAAKSGIYVDTPMSVSWFGCPILLLPRHNHCREVLQLRQQESCPL